MAGNGGLLAQYTAQYARLSELRRQLAALREAAADGRRDEEWLRFQCEELTAANLREGEQAATEAELAVLENADRIGEVLTTLRNAFDADETGILTLLKNSENDLVRIREHYPAAGEYAERIHLGARRAERHRQRRGRRLRTDRRRPRTAGEAPARLDTLYALQQKHRAVSEAELIAARDSYAARLAAIVHGDEEIAATEKRCTKPSRKRPHWPTACTKPAKKAAAGFAKQILATLTQLGMPDTVFEVALTPLAELGRTGRDNVVFLSLRPTAAQRPSPSSGIASGGELSRVMLALKALLAGACSCRRSSSTK